jgi:type IV pilus modification protein PilV
MSDLNSHSNQRGFAMIEALVTAVIVAIAVSGVGVLLLRSIQATQDSAQLSQGMWIVQDFVGRMRANSNAAKQGNYIGDTDLDDCEIKPAPLCASYNSTGTSSSAGVSTEILVDCSPEDMAAYDTWTTVCGFDNNSYDTPSDFIANPRLSNTCTITADNNDCEQYSVSFTWDTRLKKGSADAALRTNTNNYSMIIEVN